MQHFYAQSSRLRRTERAGPCCRRYCRTKHIMHTRVLWRVSARTKASLTSCMPFTMRPSVNESHWLAHATKQKPMAGSPRMAVIIVHALPPTVTRTAAHCQTACNRIIAVFLPESECGQHVTKFIVIRAKILIRSAARTGRGREVAVTDGRDDGKGVDTRFNVFDACQTATKPLKSNCRQAGADSLCRKAVAFDATRRV